MASMAMSTSSPMLARVRDAAVMQVMEARRAAREETVGTTATRFAVVNGSLAAFSLMNGILGNPKLGGVVAYDGLAALVLHGAALGSRYIPGVRDMVPSGVRSVTHMVADGAAGSFFAKVFTGLGADIAKKMAAPAGSTAGYEGRYNEMAGVGALSADEAARYVKG